MRATLFFLYCLPICKELTTHLFGIMKLQENHLGFVKNPRLIWDNGLIREQVAPRLRKLSDSDLNCMAAFIAACKTAW